MRCNQRCLTCGGSHMLHGLREPLNSLAWSRESLFLATVVLKYPNLLPCVVLGSVGRLQTTTFRSKPPENTTKVFEAASTTVVEDRPQFRLRAHHGDMVAVLLANWFRPRHQPVIVEGGMATIALGVHVRYHQCHF